MMTCHSAFWKNLEAEPPDSKLRVPKITNGLVEIVYSWSRPFIWVKAFKNRSSISAKQVVLPQPAILYVHVMN